MTQYWANEYLEVESSARRTMTPSMQCSVPITNYNQGTGSNAAPDSNG